MWDILADAYPTAFKQVELLNAQISELSKEANSEFIYIVRMFNSLVMKVQQQLKQLWILFIGQTSPV